MSETYECVRCGRDVRRQGVKDDEGWWHAGCHKDDEIQRRHAARDATPPQPQDQP